MALRNNASRPATFQLGFRQDVVMMTVILSYKEHIVIVDELFGHVSWYLFKGALVTSTMERGSLVSVRGIEFGMATSDMQREEY